MKKKNNKVKKEIGNYYCFCMRFDGWKSLTRNKRIEESRAVYDGVGDKRECEQEKCENGNCSALNLGARKLA